ncbi:R3H domain-containing protein 1 [Trichoplax sp. H2]|nr:R3H domain-containing protein 1 [Trichoplax sp. H2]|eukprot:RDD37089.1 R3H domain-containing protein 1 [Trichoplax sp. H2]
MAEQPNVLDETQINSNTDADRLSNEEDSSNVTTSRTSHPKFKTLPRSHALYDSTTLPPSTTTNATPSTSNINSSSNSIASESTIAKTINETSNVPTCTTEQVGYTDNSGNDVRAFVYEKLQDPKLRTFLLSVEEDIRAFLADNKLQSKICPPMTSYYRMVIHRVAAYFGLEHNVDASGKAVIITKVPNTRHRLVQNFIDIIANIEANTASLPPKAILKRQPAAFEDKNINPNASRNQGENLTEKRSKSIEEREEEYEKARARIFNQNPPISQSDCYNWLDDESKRISSKGWHSDSEVGGWTSTDSTLDNSATSESKKAPVIALATGDDGEKFNSAVTTDTNHSNDMDTKRKKENQLLKLTRRNNSDSSTSKSNVKSIDSGVDTDTCGGSVEIQISCDVPDDTSTSSKVDNKISDTNISTSPVKENTTTTTTATKAYSTNKANRSKGNKISGNKSANINNKGPKYQNALIRNANQVYRPPNNVNNQQQIVWNGPYPSAGGNILSHAVQVNTAQPSGSLTPQLVQPGLNDNLAYQHYSRQSQMAASIGNLSNSFQQQLFINNNYSVPKPPSPSLPAPQSPRLVNQNNAQFLQSPQASPNYPVHVMNVPNPQQDNYVNLMLNNGSNQQNISQQQYISSPSQNSPMYVAQGQPVGPTVVYMQEPKRQQVVLQQQHPQQNFSSMQQERMMYQNVMPATNQQQGANYQAITNMNYVQQSAIVPQVPTANYGVMSNSSATIPMVNQSLSGGNMTVAQNQGMVNSMMTYEPYMKNQQSFHQDGISYTPLQPAPSPNNYVHTSMIPAQPLPGNVHYTQMNDKPVSGRINNHKSGSRNRILDGNSRANESHFRPRYSKENSRERRDMQGNIGNNDFIGVN